MAAPDHRPAGGGHGRASRPHVRAVRVAGPPAVAAPGHRRGPARPGPAGPAGGACHAHRPARRHPGAGRLPGLGLAQGRADPGRRAGVIRLRRARPHPPRGGMRDLPRMRDQPRKTPQARLGRASPSQAGLACCWWRACARSLLGDRVRAVRQLPARPGEVAGVAVRVAAPGSPGARARPPRTARRARPR